VMLDLSDPANPTRAGCVDEDGYTHDAQCVNYAGPDASYQGREICINSNEDTLTIFDVTNKSGPVMVARQPYIGVGYTHQGWLTDDHRYFVLGDEADEITFGVNTRTYIWDLADLDNPAVIGIYDAATPAIDHNQYIHNGLLFQANYRAGLRVLSIDEIGDGTLSELGFLDTVPGDDNVGGGGSWSLFPYYDSGSVIISDSQGLFVAGLSGALAVDTDNDGVADSNDNCINIENADQRDSNGDGIGNVCDADLNDDCDVNFEDLAEMKLVFFTEDPDADLNGDDNVNFGDLAIMKDLFFAAPGPSGVPNDCAAR